jgi:hypothetical protein
MREETKGMDSLLPFDKESGGYSLLPLLKKRRWFIPVSPFNRVPPWVPYSNPYYQPYFAMH